METQNPRSLRPLNPEGSKDTSICFRLPMKTNIKPIMIDRNQMTPRFNHDTPVKDTKTTNATNPDTDRSKEFDSKVKELSDMFQNCKLSPEVKRVIQESLTSSLITESFGFGKNKKDGSVPKKDRLKTGQKEADNSNFINKQVPKGILREDRTPTPQKKSNRIFFQPKLMKKLQTNGTPTKPLQSSVILRPKSSSKVVKASSSSDKRLNSAANSTKLSLSKQSSSKSLRNVVEKQTPKKLAIPTTPSTLYTLSRQSIQQKLVDRFRKPIKPKTARPKELKLHSNPKDSKKLDEDNEDAFIERVYNRLMKLNFQLSSQYKAS